MMTQMAVEDFEVSKFWVGAADHVKDDHRPTRTAFLGTDKTSHGRTTSSGKISTLLSMMDGLMSQLVLFCSQCFMHIFRPHSASPCLPQ